jgi:hypothetical protein
MVYMTPNDVYVADLAAAAAPGSYIGIGQPLYISGTGFPLTEELRVSIYIVLTDTVTNEIIAVKDITSSVTNWFDSETIVIAALPPPPDGDGTTWLAVGGFDPAETTHHSAKELIYAVGP